MNAKPEFTAVILAATPGTRLDPLTISGKDEFDYGFNVDGEENPISGSSETNEENEFGKENVIVIKDAMGGQPIRRWYKNWVPAAGGDPNPKNGDLYDRLMKKVLPAIEGQKLKSITFVWMQGERDAREKHGECEADKSRCSLQSSGPGIYRSHVEVEDPECLYGPEGEFDNFHHCHQ